MPIYKYRVPEQCEESEYEIESEWRPNSDLLDYIAEEVADDYHGNHDGWECHWPVEFDIYEQNGEFLGRFSVDRESVPQFSATKLYFDPKFSAEE